MPSMVLPILRLLPLRRSAVKAHRGTRRRSKTSTGTAASPDLLLVVPVDWHMDTPIPSPPHETEHAHARTTQSTRADRGSVGRGQTWLTSLRNISTSQRLTDRKHTQNNLMQAERGGLRAVHSDGWRVGVSPTGRRWARTEGLAPTPAPTFGGVRCGPIPSDHRSRWRWGCFEGHDGS